jgi:hypothetical protein
MLNLSTYTTVCNQFVLTDDQCKLQFKYQTIQRNCICIDFYTRKHVYLVPGLREYREGYHQ